MSVTWLSGLLLTKLGMCKPGGSLRGVKWQHWSLGGGVVHELLQSSSRHSDSGFCMVWGTVRVTWNMASTAGLNHSLVRALTQHFEKQGPVRKEEGLLERVSLMELWKVLIRVTL
jgi:hypothetical protein